MKGHQDDFTVALDEWARMNIDVNLEDKYHWEEAKAADLDPQQTILGKPWSLWIGD